MIISIHFPQDIILHHIIHIIIQQQVDIGYLDIMTTIIFHHTHTPAHFTAIIYTQDHPIIHHTTGETILLIHICIIVHIFQDILQLEAHHTMTIYTLNIQ